MLKKFAAFSIIFFLLSCSDYQALDINVPTTSKVEKLIEHSKEFERQVISFNTPGGKIHFAIGFGIANSIMVEGDGENIIIDASDSVFEAEKIYSLFARGISKNFSRG